MYNSVTLNDKTENDITLRSCRGCNDKSENRRLSPSENVPDSLVSVRKTSEFFIYI